MNERISICDGLRELGSIVDRGGAVEAYAEIDGRDQRIGVFRDRRAAVAAIREAVAQSAA